MNEKTIYIAGKISNNPTFQKDFSKAVQSLKDKGYKHIVNPCCISCLDLKYEQYLSITFAMIDISDAVYFLSNWKESDGAKREYLYATSKQKEILYE